jgi:hypothetical protein
MSWPARETAALPPPSGGGSATTTSVVRIRDPIDAAFSRVERETIVGSVTPAEMLSSYSPESALKV